MAAFGGEAEVKNTGNHDFERPESATCGHSPKRLNCRPLRRDINSSWFGCTKQLPNYQMVRMNESPEIETHIINSGDAIGGAGEPETPAIAPALANVICDAIGIRTRELPIKNHSFRIEDLESKDVA